MPSKFCYFILDVIMIMFASICFGWWMDNILAGLFIWTVGIFIVTRTNIVKE